MREFTIYSLDDRGRAASTEHIAAADEESARAATRARLTMYPRVELWEGPVCLSRKSRETHGTPGRA
jgi:hypothetical protein